jgi:hypothetical protein
VSRSSPVEPGVESGAEAAPRLLSSGGIASMAPPTGQAAAALMGAGFGILGLGGANAVASAYQPFEEALLLASRFFLPGGSEVAAYGGKQLVGLIVWLGSWALLHWRLGHRQVSLAATVGLFLGCLILGTFLLWPPIVHSLARLVR